MASALKQELGLVQVYEGVDGSLPAIDIVAVHGIAADSKRTWTKNGVSWLTDPEMLPSALPQARVFRFGYESEWLGSKAIQVKISTIANQLLQALKALQSSGDSRPMIFVGHCFGGIVIEKMLLLSEKTSNTDTSLIDKIAGVITLGTPHSGSASQPIASIVASIASVASFGEDSNLIRCTSRDSEMLSDIVNEFALMARRHDIPMHCFFEQHKSDIAKLVRPLWMSWWKRMEMVVDEQSACLQGVSRQGLSSDHFQLNRFAGPEDPNYMAVKDQILEMFTARGGVEADEALNTIFLTDPEDDFWRTSSTASTRLRSTADWIFDHPTYHEWRSVDSSSLLWINGSPGKGKTMTAMAIIDRVRQESRPSRTSWLSFFLCDRDDFRRNTASGVIRGLLYHVLRKHPRARQILRSEYDKQKESLISSPNSVYSLWRILRQVISYLAYKEVMIVLDGLDKCNQSSIDILLTLIQSSSSAHQSATGRSQTEVSHNPAIKWLIVSRPDDAIHEQLHASASIKLEENEQHVNRLVEEFIEMQVGALAQKKRYDAVLQGRVKQTLLRKAEGTFLWISLACEQLRTPGVRAMHTERMIHDLPSGLTPLYQRIFEDIFERAEAIAEEDREYVSAILRSMSIAFRPLNLFELGVAADLPDEYRTNQSTLEDFVRLCGGLVGLRQDTVHFVHSSVRSFLATTSGVISPTQEEGHLWMASNCLYGLHAAFAEMTGRPFSADQTPPFLAYPLEFWIKHARNAPVDFFKQLDQRHEWIDKSSGFRDTWFACHWKATHSVWDTMPIGMTNLTIAAYASIPALARIIIETHGTSVVNDVDGSGNTALIWSARANDSDTVAILIASGANVNIANKEREVALHCAASNGDHDVEKILIAAGADLDLQDSKGWTALHRAAFGGHNTLVETLLRAGAEVDKKDQYSWTALQRSASTGDVGILRLLADNGASTEVKDREGMSPLSTASWNGCNAAITELIERRARIESHDFEGWTALHHASWNGREESVKLLIQKGADVNALNKERASPLFQATWSGHVNIVGMLLDHGADVNISCDGGETPLQQAAWTGHVDIVSVLLDRGAKINAFNDEGLTALHQASVNGQDDAVEMLLEAGADPNLQNFDGQTAYDQAEENSYASTALVLLEKGSPHPSVSSSYSNDGFGTLDMAIAKVISLDPAQSIVQRHGHACSSRSWKVTVGAGAEAKQYFLKTGPNINMFAGEHCSLKRLNDCVPLLCPRSIAYGQMSESEDAFLLTEFIRVGNTGSQHKPQTSLAQKLAKLHNAPQSRFEDHTLNKFGFATNTYAGPVLQINDWNESWEDFYAEQRLRGVCKVISEKYKDESKIYDMVERVINEVVPQLLAVGHLGGSSGIKPCLVHGDLWSGNKTCGIINENDGIQHYIFDASCCYAHSEYELGLMRMFGGFSAGFFSEYHRLVPKTEPVDEYEDRMLLYQLYHWLVNYAITGGGFKDEALSCMEKLLTKYGIPSIDTN